jgi:hypothetical protein
MDLIAVTFTLALIAFLVSCLSLGLWVTFYIKWRVSQESTHTFPMKMGDELQDLSKELFETTNIFDDDRVSSPNPEDLV